MSPTNRCLAIPSLRRYADAERALERAIAVAPKEVTLRAARVGSRA